MLAGTPQIEHPMLRTLLLPGLLLCSALGLQAQDTINVACNSAISGTYCYTNNDEHTWLWQSECGAGILLQFISGTLEAAPYDHLAIYDGPDDLAPVLYMNPSAPAATDLAGLQFGGGGSGALFMKMTSNATNCCATNGLLPTDGTWAWHWTAGTAIVGVGTVAPGDFRIWPNPAADVLTMQLPAAATGPVDIRIVDALGRVVLRKQHAGGGRETATLQLHGLVPGAYSAEVRGPHWSRTTRLQIAH